MMLFFTVWQAWLDVWFPAPRPQRKRPYYMRLVVDNTRRRA